MPTLLPDSLQFHTATAIDQHGIVLAAAQLSRRNGRNLHWATQALLPIWVRLTPLVNLAGPFMAGARILAITTLSGV
jgi:uncharacterized membrane protein